jgi:hypothetical protein
MCEPQTKCLKPENLKGKPEDCSPQQVRKCHGDVKKHPCAARKAK